MIGSILLFMAAQASTPFGVERITAQEAAKRFAQCGLGPATIRWNDPDSGGEDILVAMDVKSASDEQLRCADKAVSYYTLELPPEIENRFLTLQQDRLAAVFRAQARAWLAVHKLLDRVPSYKRGVTDDATFTRHVESLCGPRTKGAFQSAYGFHVLSPDWVKRELPVSKRSAEAFECLTNVTTAAGFEFGLIGNEYQKPK